MSFAEKTKFSERFLSLNLAILSLLTLSSLLSAIFCVKELPNLRKLKDHKNFPAIFLANQ